MKYQAVLSDPKQTQLTHDTYKIQLATPYTSALGLLCRELTFIDNNNKVEKRVACEIPFVNENNKPEKSWFMEKQIIESSGYVEL